MEENKHLVRTMDQIDLVSYKLKNIFGFQDITEKQPTYNNTIFVNTELKDFFVVDNDGLRNMYDIGEAQKYESMTSTELIEFVRNQNNGETDTVKKEQEVNSEEVVAEAPKPKKKRTTTKTTTDTKTEE